ncbi:unnamed protein product [Rhizoctonia solani]|uniref:Uncharacterized protein n=1 Tax=Rhizoctonia solani TaxID=456999 RepID=A0A8H3DM88_9AGAM|nr:unnamed protein product [Rhizoctonia solani]
MPSILSRILHPRQIRRRDEFIGGSSLGSSSDISNRLSEASLGGSRPLSMKFDWFWRQDDCPVEVWYQEQTKWSTKFTSIEHRRVLQPPFHHEYLLIHLEDGAICRLERVGEGARTDAIRRTGCTAHDIIQRFPEGQYQNDELSKVESERVVLVQFPRTFDLLDVLAICYSLQQVKRSAVYTLQRYNCYFLCMTVLNVLIRRVANWHTVIDKASWASVINRTKHNLQSMECNDAYSYLGFGICSLVNPNSSNSRKFILDSIGRGLSGEGLSSLHSAICNNFWYRDLGYAVHSGLSDHLDAAATSSLVGTGAGARQMKQLLHDSEAMFDLTKTSTPPNFQRDFRLAVYNKMTRLMQTSAQSATAAYSMREVEDPTPLSRQLSCQFISAIRAIFFIRGGENEFCEMFGEMSFTTRVRVAVRLFPFFLLLERLNSYETSDSDDDYYDGDEDGDGDLEEIEAFASQSLDHAQTVALYEVTRSPLCNTRDRSLAALSAGKIFNKDFWARSIGVCVGRQIEECVRQQCKLGGLITVHTGSQPDSSSGSQMTVAEFQEYTIKRIQVHADRVASLGLAAAKLVQSEMETTMAKVWKEMPDKADWDSPELGCSGQLRNPAEPEQSDWEGLKEDNNLDGLFSLH